MTISTKVYIIKIHMTEFAAILTLGVFSGMGVALGSGTVLALYAIVGSGVCSGVRWLKERQG